MKSLHIFSPFSALLLLTTLPLTSSDWIDPDTPKIARTTNSYLIIHGANTSVPSFTSPKRGKEFHLVMSDEFNVPNRSFADGNDPKWTALNKNDYTNNALHYYTPDNVQTNEEGEMVITTDIGDTDVIGFDDIQQKKTRITKHFKSGMLQSWNKFCFTGGIIEAEVELPGWSDIGGLWPAFWILGNMARHTYVGSSMHIWPWSSTSCTWQTEYAQKINGCRAVEHFEMAKGVGRGSPEIDIFEVQAGPYAPNRGPFWQMPVGQPFMSASYQVAPGRAGVRPGDGFWPAPNQWYDDLRYGNNTCLNILFYGSYNHYRADTDPRMDYWSDAVSFNRQLTNDHFTGKHVYRLEWGVPDDDDEEDEVEETGESKKNLKGGKNKKNHGYLRWFLDGELVLEINGISLEKAGYGAKISSEPSSIIFNTAVSSQWGFPEACRGKCKCRTFNCASPDFQDTCGFSPGFCLMMQKETPRYKVNWVRVYQDSDDEKQKVGCSTPERPTKKFIEHNAHMYMLETEKQPLKPIQRGRGNCDPSSNITGPLSCGNSTRGTCSPLGVCKCQKGWTGPNCLAPDGFDTVTYDPDDSITDLGFSSPSFVPYLLFFVLVGMAVWMVVAMKKRADYGFKPIPDAK